MVGGAGADARRVASGEEIALAWLARVAANDAWKDGAAAYLQSRIVEQSVRSRVSPEGVSLQRRLFLRMLCGVVVSITALEPLDGAEANPIAIAFVVARA